MSICTDHDPKTPSASFRMISLDEARKIVLEIAKPLRVENVPLEVAQDHVIAGAVQAIEPVPAYRASIKDGYAVYSLDGPGEYPVVLECHAGIDPRATSLAAGSVAYVSTGGPLPEGADGVVQIEDTEKVGPGMVKILKQIRPGEDVREIGSDMCPGEVVMEKGEFISGAEVGMLATVGAKEVPVYRTPHVAILSTGSEVEDPSVEELTPGKVRDSNRCMLISAAGAVGARVMDMGIARDSEEEIERAIDEAINGGADVLITSGGVSMGSKDYIKPILERKGTVHFGKICMKPGKPCTFATIPVYDAAIGHDRQVIVFGLPGNPVSALATFYLLVGPCLRQLAGHPKPLSHTAHVKTTFPITMDPQRPEYRRVKVQFVPDESTPSSGALLAYSTGGQISSRIMSFRGCNALLVVPQKKGELPSGTVLPAILLDTSTSIF